MCLNHELNNQATERQMLMCDLRYSGMLSEVDSKMLAIIYQLTLESSKGITSDSLHKHRQ